MPFSHKIKDLLTLGTSNIVTPVINGLFWIFIATVLTKNEYGEIGYLFSIVNVGFVVSLLGLPMVIIVYESKKENIFPSSLIVVLIASVITSIVVFFLVENIFASLLIIGLATFTLTLNGLIGKQKYRTYSIHQIIKAVSAVVLSIILYQFFGINGILLGYLLGVFVILGETRLFLKNKKFDFGVLKRKIRFMLQAYAARIISVVFWWGDKILIGSTFGFTFLGNYFFAAQYLILLDAIPKTINQFLLPQEARGEPNKKIKYLAVLVASIISFISILVIPIGVETFVPKFTESILPMQIMSLSLIPISISAILETEYLGRENSTVFLIGGTIQVVSYFFMIFFLGSTMGLAGLAVGLVISTILKAAYNFGVKYWFNPSKPQN